MPSDVVNVQFKPDRTDFWDSWSNMLESQNREDKVVILNESRHISQGTKDEVLQIGNASHRC